jgi:WXXGXW repeat (2 copies)
MTIRNFARSSALALCLGTLCVTGSQAASFEFDVNVAPPPERVEVVPAPRPGYIYEPGHYAYDGDRYVWRDGRYFEEREGHHYIPYSLEKRGDRWHYRAGHWDDD